MLGKALLSASVSASAAPAVYVEDVFSTYLYTGNELHADDHQRD
jgi:hypothetical protein